MSATVKLSSKLPGDPEINGLDAFADHLLDHHDELLVAVVFFDSGKAIEDLDEGTRVPVARIRRVEPLGIVRDVPQAVRDAMAEAEADRTGRKAIPFGVVEVIRSADPDGEELPEDGE